MLRTSSTPRKGPDVLDLIEAIGTQHFAPGLLALLHQLAGADHCAVFQLAQDSLREVAAESFGGSHEAKEYAARYLDQQYWRKDPSIVETQKRTSQGQKPTLIRVDVAGLDADLREAMFPHVSDRIVICGRRSGTAIGLSIIRSKPHEPFPKDAVDRLNEMADLLVCVIAKHADVIVNRPDLALALASLRDIEVCLTSQTSLPRREIEVCARILYGMSSIGIALDLGIGEESVKTYRKRVYERLHIGSERELLKWYLSMWGSFQAQRYQNPASGM